MTAPTTKQWGLTPPISTALPTQADLTQNTLMIEELRRQNNYESPAETKKRQDTLLLLQDITVEFVKEVSRRGKYPESQVSQFGGRIFPYGSYRLGVFGPGSDIDTLVVAPRHVKREDFFEIYPSVLRKLAPAGALGSLTAVPDSFVPIIKLVLCDIDIDLIFVSIASMHTIPISLELRDNKLLDGLDQPAIRAVTGPRVTDEILAAVPQHKTFRTALRAIKLWAQRRAVYANIMGFPGGVAWAMLVARVCQLYPHATGGTIVSRFFYIIKQWNWPSPIMLKAIETAGKERVWNPQLYPGDRKNIMPIITPAYPSMCATFNISKSGKTVILRELNRAHDVVQKIFDNKLHWKDLFQRHTFFTQDHKYYLSIIASSTNKEAAKAWSGLVESKVRVLVAKLEDQSDMIELARPFTKGYQRVHKAFTDEQVDEVKHGSVQYQVDETKTTETTVPQLVENAQEGAVLPEVQDAQPEPHAPDEPRAIYTNTFYVGIDLTPQATKNLNISAAISYFRSMCTSWPNFKEDLHDLNVTPCKNYELPDDVFDTAYGDVKPTKAKKKMVLNGKKPSLKRSIHEVEDSTPNGTPKKHAPSDEIAPSVSTPA